MISKLRIIAFVAFLSTSSTLFACWPYGGYRYLPYSWRTYSQESVPYYALHPPVYYSSIIARPYGWSPFAYLPGTVDHPNAAALRPRIVVNAYVDRKSPIESSTQMRSPLLIKNPYFVQANGEAPVKEASWETTQP